MTRKRSFDDIQVGEAVTPLYKTVTVDSIEKFAVFLDQIPRGQSAAAATGNPHLDEAFAQRSIFGGRFADGNHTVAHLCQMVTDWLPIGALVSGYSEVDIKLPNPVRPDDSVTVTGQVVDKFTGDGRDYAVIEVLARTQRDKVVAAGTIKAYVPHKESCQEERNGRE